MKVTSILLAMIIALCTISSSFAENGATEPGFQKIFNGKDLSGWEGSPSLWSVEDGAITGTTSQDTPLSYNQFLIWRGGILRNFELRMKVRLFGNNNSGIQYRSLHLTTEGEFVVGGYQVDIHPRTEYNGMLYEEKGRGIVAVQGQKVIIDVNGSRWLVGSTGPLVESDLTEWNEYSVVVRGNRLIHQLNGKTTIEVVDHEVSKRSLDGILAFQVHQGPPMRVQFRDIHLKELAEGGMISPSETPIPKGAEKLK